MTTIKDSSRTSAFELQEFIDEEVYIAVRLIKVIADCAHNDAVLKECGDEGIISGSAMSNIFSIEIDKLNAIEDKVD